MPYRNATAWIAGAAAAGLALIGCSNEEPKATGAPPASTGMPSSMGGAGGVIAGASGTGTGGVIGGASGTTPTMTAGTGGTMMSGGAGGTTACSGGTTVAGAGGTSAGSGGRGGKGGLVGAGGDSTAARAAAARLVSTEEWCEMRFSFLGLIVAAASGARRTPVSRRASSGVRTTVAPAPNVPPRGEPTSMVRARLGSVGRVGRDGADAGAEAGGELPRDNQCIVLEMEGRRGCEGGGLTRDWLWERA